MLRNILLGLGVCAAFFAILIFSGRIPLGSSKDKEITGTVEVWGTMPGDQVDTILQALNIEVRTYAVNYEEIAEDEFSTTLLNNLASGSGPDLILVPYQVILEQRDRIFPFPIQSFPLADFRNSYVDGAAILLSESGALALPVSIEPMMLFYNRTLFSKHGVINSPESWDEVTSIVPELTVRDSNNRIEESGIALGSHQNIKNAKDFLMTLVMQLSQLPIERNLIGGKEQFTVLADAPVSEDSEIRPLTTSLRFFTQFSDPAKSTYTWNGLLIDAEDQFVAEKLAMYVGYSGDEQKFKAINPRLDFGVKTLPKAKGYSTSVTGMKMYGVAVLKRTANIEAALAAQSMMSGAKYGPQFANIVGGVSPIRTRIAGDENLSEDLKQSALIAKGWYDINPSVSSSYVNSLISDVTSGRNTVSEAVSLFISRLSEIYKR